MRGDFLRNVDGAGFRVSMVSNTGWTSSRGVQRVFAKAGLLDCFTGWYFSGDGYLPKPNPETFYAAMRDAQVSPADVVHIGDQVRTDIQGAQTAGILPILRLGPRDQGSPEISKASLGEAILAADLCEAWEKIGDYLDDPSL